MRPYITNCCEETPEAKTIRKKNEEIERLKDVIVEQAKERTDALISYQVMVDFNTELSNERNQLRNELNDIYGKMAEIKNLLRLAKECADDTTKSAHQREVSKIRIEALQDVIDIFEEKENEKK